MKFTEIRSLKRAEVTPIDGDNVQILNTPGIIDPNTGRTLTVGEAIHLRILDVRTGEILVNEHNGERISLEEAAKRQLIDPKLVESLLQPTDNTDDKLSLLERIQREILVAENGQNGQTTSMSTSTTTTDGGVNRVKVTTTTTTKTDVVRNIADAISDGYVDPKTGLYRIDSEQFITIAEAYERGLLIRTETVKIKSNALCLYDAISHNLVDSSGWIIDRNSGDKYRLDSAINKNLINPELREIVDTRSDAKITVERALETGVLNAKTGRYLNHVTKEKLTFIEAKNRQLIIKPMTLKDIVDRGLLDEQAKVWSPTRREKLSIMEAMNCGVLDAEHIKSVTKTRGELLTLSESLTDGIILPEGKYRNITSGELLTIPEAVDRGLISSVAQKSIFDIDGFKEPFSDEFISLNLGVSKNVLRRKHGRFMLDSGKVSGIVSLEQGVESGLVRPEVLEMLNRKIGVFGPNKTELSVLDLVYLELIDPKTGYLLEPTTKTIIPLDAAIERGIITPEGALLLSSLLNITLTTETVTKTIKRYVTVTDADTMPVPQLPVTHLKEESYSRTTTVITFTEAVHRGLLDEKTQTFQDPTTGNIYSVQEALNYGLLAPDTETLTTPPTKTTITIVKKSYLPAETVQHSQTNVIQQQTSTSTTTERQILEMPPDGWSLADAIKQKLFDPVTGLFVIPGTDRLVSFEECIKLKIIHPESAVVIDPNNKRKISVLRSLEKRVLDTTGNYKKSKKETISMVKAIEMGKILLVDPMDVDQQNQRLIQITKVAGQPDLVEVSNILGETSPTFVEVQSSKTSRSEELQSPEPVQLAPGIIYDPSTTLVIFSDTGRPVDILTAIKEKRIDPNLVKIQDPKTGKEISVAEALKRGILNSETGEITDKSGKRISLIEAAKIGALMVIGAPLVAAAGAVHTLKMIIDPKTGENIPVELAVERGILSREEAGLSPDDVTRSIYVTDLTSGKEISLLSAIDSGLVTPEEAQSIIKRAEIVAVVDEEPGHYPSQGELTRARVTTEPKYKVAIGRAKSITRSPDREGKPVVLQKMRKKIVRPKDAAETGIIDKETADLLEKRETFVSESGEPLTLEEALTQRKINPEQGKILDSQTGEFVNIKEAIQRGILDPEGTNQLLMPIAKSLSIAQLRDQGLLDEAKAKIIHPETGTALSLKQAIVCEIVNPLSTIVELSGDRITLQQAIEKGTIDDELSTVQTRTGTVTLLEAVTQKLFPRDETKPDSLPLVGMTFPVAVKRGLIDANKNEITHPITGERQSIKQAIDDEFIMALPYPPSPDGVEVEEAMRSNMIDTKNGTFTVSRTGDVMPIAEAVENGHLVIKPLGELVALHASGPITSVTETVTSYHTITTKTIELMEGFSLVSSNEVKDLQTGEIIPIQEAKERGIVKDESETKEKFATREIKINFSEAVRRGLVDINAGTYTDPSSGSVMSISQAVDSGILETHETTPTTVTEQTSLTNEMMTLVEAYDTIYDEATKKFRDPKNPERLVNFTDALEEGIVDGNSLVVDVKTGRAQTLEDGVRAGLIDPKTGEVQQTSGGRMSVKEAAKLGILAVVGAPVLAGMAITDAVKKAIKKSDKETVAEEPEKPGKHVTFEKTVETKRIVEEVVRTSPEKAISVPIPPVPAKRSETETIVTPPQQTSASFLDEERQHSSTVSPPDVVPDPKKLGKGLVESEIDGEQLLPSGVQTIEETITTTTTKISPVRETEIQTSEVLTTHTVITEETTVISHTTTDDATTEDPNQIFIESQKLQTEPQQKTDVPSVIVTPISDLSFEETITMTPRSFEKLPLGDAVSQRKIDPKVCRILSEGKELPFTVQDGLDQEQLSPLDVVEILVKNTVALVDERPEFDIASLLTLDELIRLGVYDPQLEIFIDPRTGDKISFEQLIYQLGIFDPDSIFVKDLSSGEYEPLDVALEKPLIDKITGHMVDSKTGKRIPFFECINRGWIVQRRSDISSSREINPDTIAASIDSGVLTASIRDPATGDVIPMRVAIEKGIVDLERGIIVNQATMTEIDIKEAYADGFLIAGNRKPISLEATIQKGWYDPQTGKILDPVAKDLINIQEAVNQGIIDPKISIIKNTKTKTLIPLDTALIANLVNSETGKIKDTSAGTEVSLDVAVNKGIITTEPVQWSLLEALSKEYYNPESGKILNPMTGDEVTLNNAIKTSFVEVASSLIRDEANDRIILTATAIQIGLIEPERGLLTNPEITLDQAFLKGYIMSDSKPVPLTDAIARGFYDPMTGLLRIDGVDVTLDNAIKSGDISVNEIIVRDPKTGNMVTLAEGIRLGLVNAKMGLVVDPYSGLKITLTDAIESGMLIPSRRRFSLPDAVFKGLYDPKSGQFSSQIVPEKLSTDRAIRRGIIDPQSTIVSVKGKILPFELAVENGIVDGKRGTVLDDFGNKIDFREAFDRGILIEVRKPVGLAETVLKKIYDEPSGKFMHPQSGKSVTLSETLAQNIVDPNSVQFKDATTGLYKNISLYEAIQMGIISGQTSEVSYENQRISLKKAFEMGLLSDSKAPVSVQRAIHQGLYDEKTGKFTDPTNGRKITLHEATRKFLINPQLPCYFNDREEKLLSLSETCRARLIDRREGLFKEPGSDVFIPLNEAMGLGLIVDIESAGFGLYEVLAMGLYDKETGLIIHPIGDRRLTLREAITEDLVNPLCSIVKNAQTGKYVRLSEAIESNLIDDQTGTYIKPKLDLQEARAKGLIVTSSKLLSLEKIIKNQLYRPDTGKFVDPSTGEYLDIREAIESGLIDPDSTVYKNLVSGDSKTIKTAIEAGDIDTGKGRVLDSKSKRSYNYDVAFEKGLLVSVTNPITHRSMMIRKESVTAVGSSASQQQQQPTSPREMSLDEAIRYEIVNPETAVLKDPNSGKFRLLKLAISENVVDLEKRTIVDPKALFFVFDQTLIVYQREPITFDRAIESNCLDLSSGKFTDPLETDTGKQYTLKEAISVGLIDPETALIKDGAKKKLVRLPEAFRKGLIDSEKSNVLDTNTSKLYTLETAIDNGLLVTPKRSFNLLETLNYNLYNPTTGGFTDPFITQPIIDRKRITLGDAIGNCLIDPTSTMVRDSTNSTIIPLVAALSSGLVDPIDGRLVIEPETNKTIDLIKAYEKGLLLPAEQRVSFNDEYIFRENLQIYNHSRFHPPIT